MLFQVVVEACHHTGFRDGDYKLDHCGWPFPTLEEAMVHLLECKQAPKKEKPEDDESGGEDWYGDYGIMVIDDPAREAEIAERRRKNEEFLRLGEEERQRLAKTSPFGALVNLKFPE